MRNRARFSAVQCRAARALADLTIERLAEWARLEPETIDLYEQGQGQLSELELSCLGDALNNAGVIALAENLAGEGVRFSQPRRRYAQRILGAIGLKELDEFDQLPLGERRATCARLVAGVVAWLTTWARLRGVYVGQ